MGLLAETAVIDYIRDKSSTALPFILITVFLYYVAFAIYNVWFHPLKVYRGPLLARASGCYGVYYSVRGTYPYHLRDLHDRYGPVLRIAPNELSYTTAQAWQDIAGYRTSDEKRQKPHFSKDPAFYIKRSPVPDIISADDADHRRIRRLTSWAFSEKALFAQESLLNSYVSKLIDAFHIRATDRSTAIVDFCEWMNITTFDLFGDLMYGESFGSLEKGEQDPWIPFLFGAVKCGVFYRQMSRLPMFLRGFWLAWVSFMIPNSSKANAQRAAIVTKARLAKGITDRRDFIDEMLVHNDEKGLSTDEIISSAKSFVIGGGETTSTLLSGAMYYLLRNPDSLQKLKEEVRAFVNEGDMTFRSLQHLKYLNAVLEESLRVYPPVAASMPRITPPGEHIIDGGVVPGGITIAIQQWSTMRSSENWHLPDDFIPERWLGDERFAADKRQAMQPFSIGPRNCIGKNLAYAQMRTILARLVWNFDFELKDDCLEWWRQKNYMLWARPPLHVKIIQAAH